MAYRTILLKGELTRTEEAKAGEAGIYPGMLIKIDSTAGQVKKHAAAGQPAAPLFAKEDDLLGAEVGTVYTNAARCQYLRCSKGDVIAAMIEQGENITVGDYLQSSGSGTLAKYAADSAGAVEYPASVVAVALETIDLSTSSLSDTLAKVQII